MSAFGGARRGRSGGGGSENSSASSIIISRESMMFVLFPHQCSSRARASAPPVPCFPCCGEIPVGVGGALRAPRSRWPGRARARRPRGSGRATACCRSAPPAPRRWSRGWAKVRLSKKTKHLLRRRVGRGGEAGDAAAARARGKGTILASEHRSSAKDGVSGSPAACTALSVWPPAGWWHTFWVRGSQGFARAACGSTLRRTGGKASSRQRRVPDSRALGSSFFFRLRVGRRVSVRWPRRGGGHP